MKGHEKTEIVNKLKSVALEYTFAQRLRSRLYSVVAPLFERIDELEQEDRNVDMFWDMEKELAKRKEAAKQVLKIRYLELTLKVAKGMYPKEMRIVTDAMLTMNELIELGEKVKD